MTATKGDTKELVGVLLELKNPRARLSSSYTRGRPFSGLGELCWYLAKSDRTDFVSYYIRYYKNVDEDGRIYGAYGPRIFARNGQDQLANILDLLRSKPTTRRAVIQIFDASDLVGHHVDIPCTCTLQFFVRNEKLDMFVTMRSNDAYKGLVHDVFAFTMIQELVAASLDRDVGSYKHAVGSLHLYSHDESSVQGYLKEGWQSRLTPMPAMPRGDPWNAIEALLAVEERLRTGHAIPESDISSLGTYWGDLARLLESYAARSFDQTRAVADRLTNPIYRPFVVDHAETKLVKSC